ncbi:2-oxoacid:acceptor oxidoreductase subunit alpha [archaeon]|nr:MAG: 2-oxoacid:acceptor oxidoreductase subunit alpha [archaeon]
MLRLGKKKRVLTGKHFMLGNYAVVEGALAAGCDFFAGYPITPANEISERMAARMPEVGGKFLQGEDELCSIYALTGASLAGAKAMTATASAGFNYMQEGIGYAVAAEIPLVIVDVQRCRGDNYATQSDVMQMRWGASGDYEMIVLAPSSVQELFEHTIKAFNLAESYRTPVIVISETTIALMRENLLIPDPQDIEIVNRRRPTVSPQDFVPFKADPGATPPLPELGAGYRILHSLNPHDEYGGISWDPDVFEAMYERIVGKITDHRDDIVETQRFFLDDAKIVLISYGSETRPALDAVNQARENGIKAGLLKLVTIWPVPEKEIRTVAKEASVILSVEMNIGKYAGEIERVSGGDCRVVRVTKNRGEIHTSAEIYAAIKEAAR